MARKRLTRCEPARPAAITHLRRDVVTFAMQLGAAPTACSAIAYAVNEALTNALVHGYAGRPSGDLRLDAWHDEEGHMFVRVTDEGRGMVPRPDESGLGIGLNLMTRLADDVRFRDEPDRPGTSVSMRFALDGSEAIIGSIDDESPSQAPFEIRETVAAGRRVISPRGELDLKRAGELRRTLDEVARAGEPATLDLSGVSFIDSSGITLLVRTLAWGEAHGWDVRVADPSPHVLRVMQLTGVTQLLGLAASAS